MKVSFDMKVKRIFAIAVILCCVFASFSGCGEAKKIQELESEIDSLEYENEYKQKKIDDLQRTYDRAYAVYNEPHSDSVAVQQELDKLKENLGELRKQIVELERQVELNNISIRVYNDQIDRLKE